MIRTYIRCSTEEQANSALGLEAQAAKIDTAIFAHGWFGTQHRLAYIDAGYTGANMRRPALVNLRKHLRRGDVVMIARLDRISRSVADFGQLVDASRKEGWSIICLDPDLDMTTANGELVANVLMSVAQWERRITSQRTREALAAKAARGETVGSLPRVPDTVALRILELHRGPQTLRGICTILDDELIPAPRGGKWQPSTVSKVLRREENR